MTTRLVNRTERLAVIEQMLFRSPLGLRAVEIAEACAVDRRTVYRDLSLLGNVGVPIRQKDGRFFIDRERYTASIHLTLDEAMALFLAARTALRYNGHIVSALTKLSAALPEVIAHHIDQTLRASLPASAKETAALEVLVRGWGEGRKVRLWFAGTDHRTGVCDFHIYFLAPFAAGSAAVVGYDETAGRVRVFPLQSIQRARMLKLMYRIPSNFDPLRYMITSLGFADVGDEAVVVVLQFSGESALVVQDWQWHAPRSRLEVVDDYCCKLWLHVNDWASLLPWVRSWGADVEVIEPLAMRDALSREAAQIQTLYAARV